MRFGVVLIRLVWRLLSHRSTVQSTDLPERRIQAGTVGYFWARAEIIFYDNTRRFIYGTDKRNKARV